MPRIHANNYLTTVASDISSGSTALVVSSVTGFPTIGSGTTANLTLQNGSTIEIVTATSRSGTTITITRAQEGTVASSFVAGSSVSIRPTANSIDRKRDLDSYATTATAAGTTTLTFNSFVDQFFTGSTTQTVVLPAVSTLALGRPYRIFNESSGVVTVQSSGLNTIQAMAANTILELECIAITGTGIASWYYIYRPKVLPSSVGDVTGPGSSTDNAITRFDSTTGKLLQNSVVTVSDTGTIAGVESITVGTTTVATNDKVLLNDTSASDVTKTATAQAIANLAKASSTTDNAVARYDGTTGDFQNSGVIIDDSNNITGVVAATATGHVTVGGNATAAGYIELLEDSDNGSNKITITAPSSIATDKTATFPDASGTFTLLGNTATGSGDVVLATSPSLITPALGTPSSGALSSCTAYPQSALTGLGANVSTALGSALNGSGAVVGTTSATLVTPALGTVASGNISACTSSGQVLTAPVLGTPASGTLTNCTGLPVVGIATWVAPTIQRFTTGGGTYTTPANVKWIHVKLIGGGGGGTGSGTTPGAGGTGGSTSFSTLTGVGGGAATGASAGGTASGGNLINMTGNVGESNGTLGTGHYGGVGGAGPWGGCGVAGNNGPGAGAAAVANSGAGGGGAGSGGTGPAGTGGGAGGYVETIITSPSATYSYSVGAGGTGGTAGTSGAAGGAGGSGIIIVTEYYI